MEGNYSGCTCGRVWGAIIPPQPCQIHGAMPAPIFKPFERAITGARDFADLMQKGADPYPCGWDERDALV